MKTITTTVQIQFDYFGIEEAQHFTTKVVEAINEAISSFDTQPQIIPQEFYTLEIASTDGDYYDKRGTLIEIGDDADVDDPDPRYGDIHNFGFRGTVEAIKENGIITIRDMDDDCFDIEAHRIEIVTYP